MSDSIKHKINHTIKCLNFKNAKKISDLIKHIMKCLNHSINHTIKCLNQSNIQ